MAKRLCGTKQDRVSDLPDPILCHILSFLPTELAARTSILSKTWKPIWLSVPTIDLMETLSPPVLLPIMRSRDTKSPILLARLRCADYGEEDFTQFILSTTQRGVQTLDLNMEESFSFAIESQSNILTNILNCKTLTVLKLSHLIIERDIPQINVSSVKTLDLAGVFMRHTNYYCFFSAFPNLEELHAVSVVVVGRRRNIPRIEEMKAMNKCLPKLVRATARNMELIPFFSFARTLILTLKKTLRHLMVQIPIFNNLTQLELSFNFSSSGVERWKWRWLQKMLQHSPKLQHLIIHEKNEFEIDGNIWEEPATIPECLSSQLKTCLFSGYNGSDSELQFAQYIMQNSKVLLTLTIQTIPSMDVSEKYQVLQKLSEYPRGCKLLFH